MRIRVVLSGILVAACAAGCSTVTPQQTNAKLLSEESPIKKVAIMPPMILIDRVTVKGGEPGFDMCRDFESSVEDVSRKLAAKYGYQVMEHGLTPARLKKHPEILYDFVDVRERVLSANYQVSAVSSKDSIQITDKRIAMGKMKTTLQVIPFAEDAKADALVFIGGAANILSEGKQMVNTASGFLSGFANETKSEFMYLFVMVDGDDGKVLTAFVSRFDINYLICDDCSRGLPGYDTGLDLFRQDLENDMAEKIEWSLGLDREEKS